MPTTLRPPLSADAQEALQTAALQIGPVVSAALLWNRVLTPAERGQLGDDLGRAWSRSGTAGMWQRLRGGSRGRAVVDVARALDLVSAKTQRWLLRELGERHDDPECTFAEALAAGGLVLVETPRAVYWEGRRVPIDWGRRNALWDFMWELARHAKKGLPIDRETFSSARDDAVVNKLKNYLLRQRGFPRSLAEHLVPVVPHALRLDVEPTAIRLFEMEVSEMVRERPA